MPQTKPSMTLNMMMMMNLMIITTTIMTTFNLMPKMSSMSMLFLHYVPRHKW